MDNNRYSWILKNGIKTELSFSANFDNLINQHKPGGTVDGIILYNCEITSVMPFIMRYCFEENVDLKKRKFLRDLPLMNKSEIDELRLKSDFQRPLRKEGGTVRNIGGKLVIYSLPRKYGSNISFDSREVPRFVEGIVKVLDYDGVRGAQNMCIQTVQYYHQCLDHGLLH